VKNPEEVQARARWYIETELERRFGQASRRLPVLCQHNHRQALDIRKLVEGEPNPNYNKQTGPTIGLCMLGSDEGTWQGTVCEDAIDAQICEYFTPIGTKESILAKFREDLSDISWVEANMPTLYELLWVLSDFVLPKPGFWFRLWCFFMRIKLDPIRSRLNPADMLGGLERFTEIPSREDQPPG
jgi:hypothetical protein